MKKKGTALIDGIGALMALCGMSGMSDAVTGHGSMLISIFVFAIGFGICLGSLLEMKGEQ